MPEIDTIQENKQSSVFFFFVFLTLIAYISRIAELFPFLMAVRINLLLFVITFILFFTSGVHNNIHWKGNRELILIVAFLLIGLITVPFSVWPGNAFNTCKNSLMINTTIFLFCQSVIQTQKQLYGVVKIIIFSSTLLIFGLFFKPTVVEGFRITTTATYDPNDIALLFSFVFPLTLSLFISSKFLGKCFYCIILFGLTLGIIKTGSRGGMLAFGASILLIFFSSNMNLKVFYKLIIVAMVFMFTLSPRGEHLRERFVKLIEGTDYNITNTESAAGGRIAIWRSGIKIVQKNFITGIGAGNSSTAMGLEHGNYGWKTMHNSYLQALVELGLFGFVTYLAMLYRVLTNCKTAVRALGNNEDLEMKHLTSLASALRIGFLAYMIAAFFLSQAFSLILPLALAVSSKLLLLQPEAKQMQNSYTQNR